MLALAIAGTAMLLPTGSRSTEASLARSRSLVMGIRRKVELTGVSQELASPQGMPADGSAASSLFPTDDMNGGDPSINLERYKRRKAESKQDSKPESASADPPEAQASDK